MMTVMSRLPQCVRQYVTSRLSLVTHRTTFVTTDIPGSSGYWSAVIITHPHMLARGYASPKKEPATAVSPTRQTGDIQLSLGEKVKETTKTATYGGVIIIGAGVTLLMLYAVFRELFSGKSPNCVYSQALDKCIANAKVVDLLGTPVKGYGEETRRGRRRHVSHVQYVKDGVNHMRMKFYVAGSRNKGTVHLEVFEAQSGKYEFRYLFVQLDTWPGGTVIVEDNR